MPQLTTDDGAVLDIGHSRIAHTFRAVCQRCKTVIIIWDDEPELKSHKCEEEKQHG